MKAYKTAAIAIAAVLTIVGILGTREAIAGSRIHSYPGSQCRPAARDDSSLTVNMASIMNQNTAAQDVVCPLQNLTDSHDTNPKIAQVAIYFQSTLVPSTQTCFLYEKNDGDGDVFPPISDSCTTSGTPHTCAILMSPLWTYLGGNVVLKCTLDGDASRGGQGASLIGYTVALS